MYIIFHIKQKVPWCGLQYEPQKFEKQEEAEAYRLGFVNRDEYETRRFADPRWRAREYGRHYDGSYKHVAWFYENFWNYADTTNEYSDAAQGNYVRGPLDHFAHVSMKNPDKVAYTPDATKGALDIQVTTTPGRYLTKFYPELGPERIKELADMHRKKFVDLGELEFANTSYAIEEVYTDGPDSCMSKDLSEYSSYEHPVRIYADGDTPLDLAVAYVRSGGRITARTICWPAKKRYVRIYGDEMKLSILLERAGYYKTSDFSGARLAIIKHGSYNYVLPFFDFAGGVVKDGSYWLIKTCGYQYSGQNTKGLASDPYDDEDEDEDEDDRPYCDHCGERCEDSYCVLTRHRNEQHWCNSCFDGAFTCDHSGDRFDTRYHDWVEMHNGETWHSEALEEHGFACERTEEYFPNEELVTVRIADEDNEGETVIQSWSQFAVDKYRKEVLEIIVTKAEHEQAGQQRLELETA